MNLLNIIFIFLSYALNSSIITPMTLISASKIEIDLRNTLFETYNKESRPVKDVNKPVKVEMGLAIQTLEEFNQKTETIKLNIWFRMNWFNEYLVWEDNMDKFPINVLDVSASNIWTPDIELINAAALPEIYTLKGGLMLYNTGECMWSRPGIFMFSCPLDLHKFPFDTQNCKLTFSSWIFSNRYLRLVPYNDTSKAVDILNDFSHSEWKLKDITYTTENIPAANKEIKSSITYDIELERYTHYYTLTMGMTITLVYVSFLIMFLPPDNISRTSTAVFIPLTILALQLTIIDKVPVVGYFTLMDKFFLCCFISSMLVSMFSAIIFALISHKSHKVLYLFSFMTDIEKLKDTELKENKINQELTQKRHKRYLKQQQKHNNYKDYVCESSIDHDYDSDYDYEYDYKNKNKNKKPNEPDIKDEIIKNIKKINNNDASVDDIEYNTDFDSNEFKNINNYICEVSDTIGNDSQVIKTINHDNKLLDLTNDELLLYKYMINVIKHFDNFIRIAFPTAFTIYIAILLKV
jgi:hypothetical protein